MKHINFDDALMNSAYLSELWAVNDLIKLKNAFPLLWQDENETQLQDEIRHASLILNELKKSGAVIVKDLKYSMQERLYKRFIDLSKTHTFSDTLAVHSMTEHRAVWIYKTYQRLGENQNYKQMAQLIKNDEARHFEIINRSFQRTSNEDFLSYTLGQIDSFLFNEFLIERYGRLLFSSSSFWNDYYQDADFSPEIHA